MSGPVTRDPMESIRQTYFQECEELLLAMEEGLIAIEQGEADNDRVNAVFRAVHSIKGGGGAFGYEAMVTFAHGFETVLDLLRSDRLQAGGEAVKTLLRAGDMLADHVAAARGAGALPDDAQIIGALALLAGEDPQAASGDFAPADFEGLDFAPLRIVVEDAPRQTIRVDLDKVDRLVNLVGEMVITQAMLSQRVQECRLPRGSAVGNGLTELEHLLRDLQESVMAIRTQPVKSVFQRMPRLVRELAAQTGKDVRLVLEGEATEVDKTVIERLGEPLTHMIRNALDHGLETPQERIAAGKPAEGTVTLSAEHRGGRIVIEVSDDGRGIDRARVRAKAQERGLVPPGAALSDEETDNLIFLPGFSTAREVSNISGRGVGMDVVRRNIVDLGGRIVINNRPRQGSCFSLTLPLTLAVLDGMVVAVGEQTFVLPLTHIVESLKPKPGDIRAFGDGRVLSVRGAHVPLVMTGQILGAKGARDPADGGVVILVEAQGTGRMALAVDAILGQRQVVIKSFEDNYRHIEGIAAATILGDGRVALILDVDGIVTRCRAEISEDLRPTGT